MDDRVTEVFTEDVEDVDAVTGFGAEAGHQTGETEAPGVFGTAGDDCAQPCDGKPVLTDVTEEGRRDDLEAELRRNVERYAARAVRSEARAAAATMGVPENRLDDVAKLCELSGIDPEEDGARARIAGSVRDALRRVPELIGGAGTGSTVAARRPRRDAFERGFLGV